MAGECHACVLFAKCALPYSVRPRGSGDPGAKLSDVSKSGPPLPWGRTENVTPSVVAYSVVTEPARWVNCKEPKENRPLFAALGQGVALILFFRLPRKRGGRRADKAHGLDYARPARECVAPGRARIAGLWA